MRTWLTFDDTRNRPRQIPRKLADESVTFVAVANQSALHALSYLQDVCRVDRCLFADVRDDQIDFARRHVEKMAAGCSRREYLEWYLRTPLDWSAAGEPSWPDDLAGTPFEQAQHARRSNAVRWRHKRNWSVLRLGLNGSPYHYRVGWNTGYLHPDVFPPPFPPATEFHVGPISDVLAQEAGSGQPVVCWLSNSWLPHWRKHDEGLAELVESLDRRDDVFFWGGRGGKPRDRPFRFQKPYAPEPSDPHALLHPLLERLEGDVSRTIKPKELPAFLDAPQRHERIFLYYPSMASVRDYSAVREHCARLIVLEHNRLFTGRKRMHNCGVLLPQIRDSAGGEPTRFWWMPGFGCLRRNIVAMFE